MITIVRGEPHHARDMFETEAESFALPWSEISIRHEIEQKHTICFVAMGENGDLQGHAYMRHIINEGHITNIAVKKSLRRRGIASKLVAALLEAAKNHEMIGLTLEVRESNTAAISLYKKHGFISEGIRKNYYSQPTEDGIVMWKYLT